MLRIRDNKTKIIHEVSANRRNGGLICKPNNDDINALLFMTDRWFVEPPPASEAGLRTDSTHHRKVDFKIDGDLEYAAANLYGFSNNRFEWLDDPNKSA